MKPMLDYSLFFSRSWLLCRVCQAFNYEFGFQIPSLQWILHRRLNSYLNWVRWNRSWTKIKFRWYRGCLPLSLFWWLPFKITNFFHFRRIFEIDVQVNFRLQSQFQSKWLFGVKLNQMRRKLMKKNEYNFPKLNE